MAATVERLEYDPNRTAFIALIKYEDGELAYILAPQRLAAGDKVISADHADVKPGNAMPLAPFRSAPSSTTSNSRSARAARSRARPAPTSRSSAAIGDYVILRLQLAEQRLVNGRCMATIGAVSNPDKMNITIGKAGRQRWKGRLPHNRGITMNPVDHPHGGRTKGGRHWITPWGFPTKGKKTRKNKRTTKFIMVSRHDRKKKQS